jgi:predicted acylesterase/phospholipase RssA
MIVLNGESSGWKYTNVPGNCSQKAFDFSSGTKPWKKDKEMTSLPQVVDLEQLDATVILDSTAPVDVLRTGGLFLSGSDFETLVLPSGGAKGIAIMGVLKVMEGLYGSPLRSGMPKLRNILGVSVGALIGLYLALGATVDELKRIVCETETLTELLQTNFMRLLDGNMGMNDGSKMLAFLRKEIGARAGDPDVTMRGLHQKTGVALVCVRARVHSATLDFVGPWSDERACDAVFDSMRVPPLYDPARRGGETVVDGGLLCSFPFAYLDVLGLDPRKSLGVCFVPGGGHHGARPATAAPATASSRMDVNFLEFTRALIGAATRMIDGFQQKAIDPCLWEWNIVRIPLGDAYYDLEISPNVQRGRELYALGTKAGGEFFARRLLALGLIDVASALEGGADRTRTASSTGTPKVKVE